MESGIAALLARFLSGEAVPGVVVISMPISRGVGDTASLPEGIRNAVVALAEGHPAIGQQGGFFLDMTRFDGKVVEIDFGTRVKSGASHPTADETTWDVEAFKAAIIDEVQRHPRIGEGGNFHLRLVRDPDGSFETAHLCFPGRVA